MRQSSTQMAQLLNIGNLVSAERLKKWIEDTFFNKKSPINLGRFGLRTAHDVLEFMLSRKGKEELNAIMAEDILNAVRLEKLSLAILMSQLRAHLYSWFARKESRADQINRLDEIDSQNRRHYKRMSELTASPQIHQTQLAEALEAYDEAIEQLNKEAKELLAEESRLLAQQNALNQQMILTEARFALIEHHLDAALNTDDVEGFLRENTQERSRLHANIQEITGRDQSLDVLQTLTDHLFALELQRQILDQLFSVHIRAAYFADAFGQEVGSHHQAAYILERSQQIFIKDGICYLLSQDQTWDSIKDEPQLQSDAKDRFRHNEITLKNTPQHIRHKVQESREQELTVISTQTAEVQSRLSQNAARKSQNTQDLTLVKQAREDLLALQTVNLNLMPRPSPAPSPALQTFCREIQKLSHTPVTPKVLWAIADKAPLQNRSELQNYLKQELKNMEENSPLCTLARQKVLEYMEQVATKGRNSVLERQAEQTRQSSTIPSSPFDLNNKPY